MTTSPSHSNCERSFRASGLSCAGQVRAPHASKVLVFEGWRLDVLRRELRRQTGDLVPLTAGEFELLCAFARHPNRVLNRDQLIDLVKGREWAAYDRGFSGSAG
jgi:DNA-binding response OmpR family regulator